MKLTLHRKLLCLLAPIRQNLLGMKLAAALLIVTCLNVSASPGLAQNVTLDAQNASIEHIIREVRKQTGYNFVYTSDLLRSTKPVSVDVKDMPVEDFLKKCFSGQPVTFYMMDEKIVVLQAKASPGILKDIADEPINGIVLDETGKPLEGVTVRNRANGNTGVNVKTNAQGQFAIKGKIGDVLELTSIGFKKQTYRITEYGGNIIKMEVETTELTGSVVIGYGTAKRRDLTGSVASVNADEIRNIPFTSIDQAITGKAAGVQVIQADGSPGGVARIRIRGGASLIGNNDPLYIIDGVPVIIQNRYVQNAAEVVNPVETYYGAGDFNNSVSGAFSRGLNSLAGLNINDIESIDILKDASATAIYGSKAANGVVIITTKRGKISQKPILEGNYYAGVTIPLTEKVLNADQYRKLMTDGAILINQERARVGRTPLAAATSIINDPNYLGTANTDWLNLVMRNGFAHNADIAVRGGSAGSRYYASLAYNRQDGTLINTDFNRIAGKLSLDNEITPRLRVQTNLDYGFSTNNITNGVYTMALYAPPTQSPYNADGSYSTLGAVGTAYQGFQNPLAVASGINRAKNTSMLGSLALEYNILKDLKFRSVVSVNYNNYHQQNYVPSYVDIGGFYGRESSSGGTGSQSSSNTINMFFENILTWDKQLSDASRLNIVAGTSWEKYRSSFFSATGKGYPDDDFLNNLNSAAIPVSVKGSDPSSQNSLLSFYLRANYTLKDKYLFTFTGRSDASSKFAPGNQTGYFPSGAIAWRVNEDLMPDAQWIDELKLRVSAGTTGTQNIGDHLWRTLYSPVAYGGDNALIPTQLGNSAIKWESTLQKDVGLDFSFLRSRLRGTFGYYEKKTDGLLLNITTAPSSAYNNVILNIAKVRNRGLEFDLRGDIVRKRNFTWNAAFNISRNVSNVLNVNGGPFSDPNDRDNLNLGTSVVKEGEPLGLLYGRVSTGVIRTKEQLDAFKAAFPYWSIFSPYLSIGDMSYKMDSTGFWEQDIIGHSFPKFYGGFTNTLTIGGNLSIITLFTFSYGNQLIYQNDVSNFSIDNLANRGVSILDHYTPENPNSRRPRLLFSQVNFLSNEQVYDASYIKLKSMTINYTLPSKVLQRINFREMSVYASGTNLFTITKYPGLDPEVSDDPGSVIGGGRDVSSYPNTRMFVAGIRFGL